MSSWPDGFEAQLSGKACPMCEEGRPEEVGARIRFYSSDIADAYLHLHGVQRGYVVVIWRGRHVVEPTDLTEAEATAFWFEALRVSRAMQAVYRPLKKNFSLLGNRVAHLHWILAPRFVDDIAPGDPLPGSGYHDFPEDEIRGEVRLLREALAQTS